MAVSLIDITRTTMTSYYFYYDPIFKNGFALGKLSILIEIQYV